jgi:hypothetical protein
MSSNVKDLTLDELTTLIEQVVDSRLAQSLKPWYTTPMPMDSSAYLQQLRASLIPTPTGVPTPSDMIIEERETWRSSLS